MDAGLDKQQLEDLKKWAVGVVSDPVKLRFYLCLLLLAVGYLGFVRPLGQRLVLAQEALKESYVDAARAANSAHYVHQRTLYDPKLTSRDDVVYWQEYITAKLDASGVRLNAIDPGETTAKYTFKIVRMQLSASAVHYQDIVDFVDRVEHGEHIVRIESMMVDETTDGLILTCGLQALVKPGLKVDAKKPAATGRSSEAPGTDGATDDRGPAAELESEDSADESEAEPEDDSESDDAEGDDG